MPKNQQMTLPLTPRTFHVLLALAEGPQNGYRISILVEENTGGMVRLAPGTLYEALHRLREQGLIEPASDQRRRTDGRGQRYYRLTARGRRLLRDEAERLASDVAVARAARVFGDHG